MLLSLLALVAAALAVGFASGSSAAGDPTVTVVQTSPHGPQALVRLPDLSFSRTGSASAPRAARIDVFDHQRLQPIWGVGAAITNSSAYLLQHGLSTAHRDEVLRRLFAPDGAGLALVRISLGGSDFNAGGLRYSEDDLPPGRSDPQLRHFSLAHDRDVIAVLRAALRVNPHLLIVASPWSPPAWMKTNGSLTNVNFSGHFKTRYYAVYARYFVKFLEGYRQAGIPIFAVSAENEPNKVPARYEGMNFPPEQSGTFIARYLRPALQRAHLATQVYGADGSWGVDYLRAQNRAAGGLQGAAWHCYDGNPDQVMPRFAFLPQMLSECSPSLINAPVSSLMSNVFSDGARGALLWNVALDPQGGPVVPPNAGCGGCAGVLTLDPRRHTVSYSSAYYDLAHYGHFLAPGARRIAATRLGHFLNRRRTSRATPGLHDVAFRNPDGHDVLVVYNNSPTAAAFTVRWRGRSLRYTLSARATVTLEWAAP